MDGSEEQYFWPEWCDTLYESVTIPEPVTGTPEVFNQHPEFITSGFNRVRWYWRFDTPEKYQMMVKGYYRMISGVDAVIGRIRQKLDQHEFADNTVIVLMGDNGYFLGERQFAGKWLMYEQSLRVPMIIYDPRIAREERGVVTDITGLNIDVAPTFLQLAGIAVPSVYQGESMVPLIRRETVENREYVLFEHLWDFENIPQSECIRSNDYKLINYPQHPGYQEFYDLINDPGEVHNLIADFSFQHQINRFRVKLDSLKSRVDPEASF